MYGSYEKSSNTRTSDSVVLYTDTDRLCMALGSGMVLSSVQPDDCALFSEKDKRCLVPGELI